MKAILLLIIISIYALAATVYGVRLNRSVSSQKMFHLSSGSYMCEKYLPVTYEIKININQE